VSAWSGFGQGGRKREREKWVGEEKTTRTEGNGIEMEKEIGRKEAKKKTQAHEQRRERDNFRASSSSPSALVGCFSLRERDREGWARVLGSLFFFSLRFIS